jgi:hypothetical protein
VAADITAKTVAPLTPQEQRQVIALLRKLS